MVERIARIAGTGPGDLVLDLGCGVGGPARRLSQVVGCRVVGVDVVEELVRIGSDRRPARTAFVAGAADAIPLRSSSADQVWSLGVASHVPDHGAMAMEIARVLRPGGTLALTEAFWEGRRAPRFAETAPRPWRPTTLTGFMSALEDGGLREIRALPWPGRGVRGAPRPRDPELARDIRDGILIPQLVVAVRQ